MSGQLQLSSDLAVHVKSDICRDRIIMPEKDTTCLFVVLSHFRAGYQASADAQRSSPPSDSAIPTSATRKQLTNNRSGHDPTEELLVGIVSPSRVDVIEIMVSTRSRSQMRPSLPFFSCSDMAHRDCLDIDGEQTTRGHITILAHVYAGCA